MWCAHIVTGTFFASAAMVLQMVSTAGSGALLRLCCLCLKLSARWMNEVNNFTLQTSSHFSTSSSWTSLHMRPVPVPVLNPARGTSRRSRALRARQRLHLDAEVARQLARFQWLTIRAGSAGISCRSHSLSSSPSGLRNRSKSS